MQRSDGDAGEGGTDEGASVPLRLEDMQGQRGVSDLGGGSGFLEIKMWTDSKNAEENTGLVEDKVRND